LTDDLDREPTDVPPMPEDRDAILGRMEKDRDYLRWKYGGSTGARSSAYLGAFTGAMTLFAIWIYPAYFIIGLFRDDVDWLPNTLIEIGLYVALLVLLGGRLAHRHGRVAAAR
jgi:hypothetical protein